MASPHVRAGASALYHLSGKAELYAASGPCNSQDIDAIEPYIHRMTHAEFIIAFHGEAVEGGRIDVRDLAPALLALGRAIDAANLAINGERQPIKVEVRAVAEGSFEVYLDVVLSRWEQLKSLLSHTDVEAAKQLLEWMGLIGGGGISLIALYRWLSGKQIDKVERHGADGVTIFADGQRITVPWEVLRLYQDVAVNTSLNQLLTTLENEAIEKIDFRQPGAKAAEQTLTKADKPVFSLPAPPEETVIDDTRTLALSIRSLAFQEGNKWRLYDGQNVITATIEDKDFINKIDLSQIRFAKGDILICEVRSVQKQTAEGLKTEHYVLRVLDHRPAATQIMLPFEDRTSSEPQP